MVYHVCANCNENRVENHGDICQRCKDAKERGYYILSMAGSCRNGAERDHGTRFHAVPFDDTWKAVCGAQPGRHSAGWSSWQPAGQQVTCPRCLKKLAKV